MDFVAKQSAHAAGAATASSSVIALAWPLRRALGRRDRPDRPALDQRRLRRTRPSGAFGSDWVLGDRVVYGDIAFGAYATARLHPADRLVRIPAGVSDDQAASAFLKGLTARYLLKEVLELRPGDTVLYHAAAGGVGQIFVQWAKALGLKVIGTVSSDAKAKLARHAGCDHVINYSSEDFVAEALAFTAGNGVAAVFDSVGADTFRGSLAVLRPRGTLVQFGKTCGKPGHRWTHSSWHHARFI